MSRALEPVTAATLARAEALQQGSAMANWFGFKARIEEDALRYRLTFDEPHIGNPVLRALHGGVISAFMEYCAQIEIEARLSEKVRIRSISVHTSYLRGSLDQDLEVSIHVKRIGRRIAFVEALGWQSTPSEAVSSAHIALRLFRDDEA